MAKKSRNKTSAGSGSGDRESAASDPQEADEEAREAGRRKEPQNALHEWVKSILVAVVLFFVLRTFLVQTFVITSGSMEESLLVGDMLVVNRAALGSQIPLTSFRVPGYSDPHRGDVIVFDPPHEEDMMLVKRLIGLPGDTLSMTGGVLYLNGQRQDEPYVQHVDPADTTDPRMIWQREHLAPGVDPLTYEPTRDNWGPIVVPDGRYFMMGDNRDTSLDSRYWGLLERWRLEGRAMFIYYSYNKDSYRPFSFIREVRWSRLLDPIR